MKKLLLLAAITCSTISFGQRVIKNELDLRTNKRYILTNLTAKPYFKDLKNINKEGGSNVYFQFQTEIDNNKTINILNITLQRNTKSFCINNNAEIVIVFDNNQELILKNSSSSNCGLLYTAFCDITTNQIQQIAENKIQSVIFYTTAGPLEFKSKQGLQNLSLETAKLHLEEINKIL